MLVYDIEIAKAIPPKDDKDRLFGIKYCEGWHDHKGMGVSCIGAFDGNRSYCFFKDNFEEFRKLTEEHIMLVGFNSVAFDNAVLRANDIVDIDDSKCVDLLVKVWQAIGLEPPFQKETHNGYGLNALCKALFGSEKTGDGAMAPVLFQCGEYGSLVNYCLNDISLTNALFWHIQKYHFFINPKTGEKVNIRLF